MIPGGTLPNPGDTGYGTYRSPFHLFAGHGLYQTRRVRLDLQSLRWLHVRLQLLLCDVLAAERSANDEWGRWLRAKKNAVQLAERHGRKVAGQAIYMSSVTDPYQPVERSLFLTRGILESLIPHQPRLVVQTRGPLIVRDIDLLMQFQSLRVNISIPTDSERVRLAFEPKSPPLQKRWKAVHSLLEANIHVGICVTPTLPLEDIDHFADRLATARADVLVVQDFHNAAGGFGADTSAAAKSLARGLGWNADRYRAFTERLRDMTTCFEGEAGFFPPL